MALLLEEPEELEEYVDPFNPRAWHIVWLRAKLLLPIVLYGLLCGCEMIAFSSWRNDDSKIKTIGGLILISAVMVSPMVWLAISKLRFRKQAKPSIEITPEGISGFSAKEVFVDWERVLALSLDPMRGAPGLAILRVQYSREFGTSFFQRPFGIRFGKKKRVNPRDGLRLRVTLANPSQAEPLRKELQRLRQMGKPVPVLTEQRFPPFQARWLYLSILGIYLMQHGAPLLMIGLWHQPSSDSPPSDRMSEKIGSLLAEHFHSVREMMQFYINTGAILLGAGVIMYAAGFIIPARQRKVWELTTADERLGEIGLDM